MPEPVPLTASLSLLRPALLTLAALAVAGVLMALAALLERSGPIRLRQWAEEAGESVRRLYEVPERFEAFRFLLSWAARLALLALLLALLQLGRSLDLSHPAWTAFAGAALFSALLELLNRALVTRRAEDGLRRGTLVYRAFATLSGPLTLLLSQVSPFQQAPVPEERSDDEEQASEEEIEAFLDVGTKEGILEPSEAEMVWGIVDFGDTVVRSVMTPRIDIVGVRQDAALPEVARMFADSKHTRIPMYAGSVDQIVGILHALDVLEALQGPAQRDSRSLAKPPLFIPESKPLSELLREFQNTGQQMAIVVNEHGSTAGLVTIEDVLEEIVGEIGDEYEKPVSEREELPGGAWRLDGGAHIDVLDELFAVQFDEPPYETVGGLVMSALGDVPQAGDVAHAFGLRFTVESAEGRRVDRVRVERAIAGEAPNLGRD